jgi:hypothetical protein
MYLSYTPDAKGQRSWDRYEGNDTSRGHERFGDIVLEFLEAGQICTRSGIMPNSNNLVSRSSACGERVEGLLGSTGNVRAAAMSNQNGRG